jgi:hypothetical protein
MFSFERFLSLIYASSHLPNEQPVRIYTTNLLVNLE